MIERFYKRKEVRDRLNLSKRKYQQVIDSGILEKPIRLTENSHPLHTESQIVAAEQRIFERANRSASLKANGGISEKLFREIRETYQ